MNRNSRLPVSTTPSYYKIGRASGRASRSESRKDRNTNSISRTNSMTRTSNLLLQPVTPCSIRRSKSCNSLGRTPQSTTTNRSIEPLVKIKDTRPITDKKWQAEMLAKCSNYFKCDPNANKLLQNNKIPRPLTNTLFVSLINVLLKNIDPSIEELTTKTYVEVLPKYLKMFMYSGSISTSALKTANTSYSFPSILALLSALVTCHEVMEFTYNNVETFFWAQPVDLIDNKDIQLKLIQTRILMNGFSKWSKEDDDSFCEIEYEEELKKLYEYSEDKFVKLKALVNEASEQLKIKDKFLDNLQEQTRDQGVELDEINDKIEMVNGQIKQQNDYIDNIDERIKAFEFNNKKLEEQLEKYLERNEELKEKVNVQTISKKEFDSVQHQINDYNETLALELAELSNLEEISDELDIKLSNKKREIEKEVSEYNMNLVRYTLKYPKLNDFVLPQERLLHSNYLKDYENIISKQNELLQSVESEVESLKVGTYEFVKEEKKCAQMHNNLTQTKEETEQLINTLEKSYETILSSNVELTNKIESVEKEILDFYQPVNVLENQEKIIEQLKMENADLNKQMKDNYQQLTSKVLETEKQVLEKDLPEIDASKQKIANVLKLKIKTMNLPD